MKSIIQASIFGATLAVSGMALAQSPAFSAAAAVREVAQGRSPDSAILNGASQPSAPKGNVAAQVKQPDSASAEAAKLVAATPASTQPPPAVTSSNASALGPGERFVNPKAKELEALQQEIPLWKAKAEIAKYRAEIAKAEQSMGGPLAAPLPGTVAPQTMPGPMPNSARIAPATSKVEADGMRLVTLRAFDGRFDAIVDVGGSAITVRVGDAIGAWQVASIDGTGVKLTSGKRVHMLRL